MVIALAWALLATHPAAQTQNSIHVWTDRSDPYHRGNRASVVFRLDAPAYVTVLRVDTDGRLEVLFPRNPWADNYLVATRAFGITNYRGSGYSFAVDDDAGVGYVFAIASSSQFDYADLVRGSQWDYRLLNGGRVRGDPYVALTDLAERIVREGDYEYDLASYDVDRHYDYPRFVCAECHTQPRDRGWDEYRLECARFRLVIYDDPVYYPYRYNQGRNVVVRPLHPGPRFIFRDAVRGTSYVTHLRGRPDETDRRRVRELSPVRPLVERHRTEERRREEPRGEPRRRVTAPESTPRGLAPAPRSTGEPELRRRKHGARR